MISNLCNRLFPQSNLEQLSDNALKTLKSESIGSDEKAIAAAQALFVSIVNQANVKETLNEKVSGLDSATQQVILRAAIELAKKAKQDEKVTSLTKELEAVNKELELAISAPKKSCLPSAKTVAKIAAAVAVFALGGVGIAYALAKANEANVDPASQCAADSELACPANEATRVAEEADAAKVATEEAAKETVRDVPEQVATDATVQAQTAAEATNNTLLHV